MYTEAQVADIILFIKRTTHLIISSIAVVVLINIWQNYYSAKVRSFHRTAKDYGLLFLCGGILVWGFVNLLGLLKGNKNELAGWDYLRSTTASFCALLLISDTVLSGSIQKKTNRTGSCLSAFRR